MVLCTIINIYIYYIILFVVWISYEVCGVCVCVFDVTVWYSGMDIFCADFAIQYTGSSSDGSGGGATC